jgi:hypothetical protein
MVSHIIFFILDSMKYIIKMKFACFFLPLIVSFSRTVKITSVAHITLQQDSVALAEHWLLKSQLHQKPSEVVADPFPSPVQTGP